MMDSFAVPTSFQNPCPGHCGPPASLLLTQLIQTLLTAHCNISSPNDYPRDYGNELKDDEEFDFVVVGAGSSGSVIASRLSENPNWRVLLLEAGGDPQFVSDVPGFLFSAQETEMDWKYVSEPSDTSCGGMVDRRCPYPRGKVLGGSSTINAMLYVRGNPKDFDEWESLGNEGWNYENVLKYFKKSESLTGYALMDDENYEKSKNVDDLKGRIMSSKYHSQNGPLTISSYADGNVGLLKKAIYDAFEKLNIPSQIDINGKSQIGITSVPGTLIQGTRANTAKMFLNSVKDRQNLFVVKNAVAKKLLIKNKTAEGVEFIRNDQVRRVKAKKEVIVSAGAINSPQLLMLSGLGPKDHLESVGIKPILDLKGVGENFQDHYLFLGIVNSILKEESQPLHPLEGLDAMYMFLTKRPGLFSSIGLTDLTGFVDTKDFTDVPDIQYLFLNFLKDDSYLLPEILRAGHFTDDLRRQYLEFVKESGVVLIAPTVLRPNGRGKVLLKSGDVTDPPIIDSNILGDPDDLDTLLRGIKFAEKVMETDSFLTLKPKALRFDMAECKKLKDVEYWKCLTKYLTMSLYHPAGTCKMGPKSDPLAVVDNRLRVHGIKKLRVADASIMPLIVRGNTNAACIMIGEMCSDMIKEDWERHEHTEL